MIEEEKSTDPMSKRCSDIADGSESRSCLQKSNASSAFESEGAIRSEREDGDSLVTTGDGLLKDVYAVSSAPSAASESERVHNSTSDSLIVPSGEDTLLAQTVLATSEGNLVDGFINTTRKDELLDGRLNSSSYSAVDERGEIEITPLDESAREDFLDMPPWAARLKGCERIGDSYRGYVHTEAELDILLSMHKEHTKSCWGTRQSPSSQKPSVRFMWKSLYVPYDGIPFLNSGRRATVMECQFGPRRKGNKVKIESNEDGQPVKRAHRPTCPARIYIKRVRKFPEFKIDASYEGTSGLRLAQERALTALRVACLETTGEERFYVQFPLEIAHEYHYDDEIIPNPTLTLPPPQGCSVSSRLDPRVVEKINELVARGVTETYHVKHGVINFVEKELFHGSDEAVPARHNKTYFPTITDLQNHIFQAKMAIEAGTMASLPPHETSPKALATDDRSRKRKRFEPRRVRASKTSAPAPRTICIRTDDPLEMAKDGTFQGSQGQVYVMVPSASGLFANSDSLIGAALDTDKTASLVQVLTVPSSPSFLMQQGENTLDLSRQFLALPIVSYGNHDQISSFASHSMTADDLGENEMDISLPNISNTSRHQEQPATQLVQEILKTGNSTEPVPSAAINIANTVTSRNMKVESMNNTKQEQSIVASSTDTGAVDSPRTRPVNTSSLDIVVSSGAVTSSLMVSSVDPISMHSDTSTMPSGLPMAPSVTKSTDIATITSSGACSSPNFASQSFSFNSDETSDNPPLTRDIPMCADAKTANLTKSCTTSPSTVATVLPTFSPKPFNFTVERIGVQTIDHNQHHKGEERSPDRHLNNTLPSLNILYRRGQDRHADSQDNFTTLS